MNYSRARLGLAIRNAAIKDTPMTSQTSWVSEIIPVDHPAAAKSASCRF
jgi:hypothetical protein